MHVSDVEVVPVAHREPRLRNSWGAHSDVAARTVLRLTTADGTVGVSETYGDDQVIAGLEAAADLVEGMNPFEREPLRMRLQDPMVFGAIETALYDLIGRTLGEPVHALLGGRYGTKSSTRATCSTSTRTPIPGPRLSPAVRSCRRR